MHAWPRLSRLASADPRSLATLYLAVFGGLQVVFLWTYRARFGSVIPILGTALLFLLLFLMVRRADAWNWKILLLLALIAVTTFGPSVVAIIQRVHAGLTFEVDGLAMDEVAVDRVIHGRGIYGVDWSGTQVDGYVGIWGGVDLHYYIHFPLMVLSAIPVRVLTDVAHIAFDYRMVLILFSLIAMGAIALLPTSVPARFAVAVGILLNPAVSLGAWTGHDDMCYLAMLLLGLALLARKHWWLAVLALGTAMALKPFAIFFVPLLLAIVWLQSDQSRRTRARQALGTCVLFGLPTLLSVGPFLLANPSGTIRDLIVYPSTLIHVGGFGLGGILVALGIVQPDQPFSLGLVQFVVVVPIAWLVLRAFTRRPDLGQFLASYSVALFAFVFTARYFGDNYGAALMGLVLCVPALATVAVPGPSGRTVSAPLPDARARPVATAA